MNRLLKNDKLKISLILFVLLVLIGCQNSSIPKAKIKIWYGLEQSFGKMGNAQRQINILGNIYSDNERIKAYYTLNNAKEKNYLTLGCDLHRLANRGDFNIEIERDELQTGKNVIRLFVALNDKIIDSESIVVKYIGDQKWPLPYRIDWNNVKNIQDVAEIIDGEWKLTGSGVRTKHKYYDRVLAFGDSSWRNYEVETTVTFHGYTPPVKGPPTYNVSHVAIASRWPGHDKDTLQPNRKWFPLGATSEFRITDNYDSCRWRIFDGENLYKEQQGLSYRQIQPETVYRIKHRVEDISENETLYSVKFWKSDEQEPSQWDFQAVEVLKRKESGSACLIAHHTDVTFGNVTVRPISQEE